MIIQKKAYAKINLYLKILSKLPNGYHNIFTIMQKISLCDNLKININHGAAQKINIICDDKNVPTDKSNTAYKAAELFLERVLCFNGTPSVRPLQIEITIDKKIPIQAGLGGGSSDAGAVLLGLNEYFDFILPENILIEIAAKIGADVPFFVKNINCAVCEGIGEIVTPVYINLSDFFCVIVKPAFNVSTKQAYEDWDRFATSSGASHNAHPTVPATLRDALENIHNDFSGLVFSQNKNIKEIKDLILKSGATASELSGSGSAVFGIFDNFDNAQKCREKILRITQNDNFTPDIEFCDIFKFLC